MCRLVDIARIEKPLTDSAGHELFDLRGRDTQSGRSLRLTFSDQRARDIVVVARALLDRVGRRHAVAVAIKQHPGEQAWLGRAGAGVALRGIADELRLHCLPERLVDDRRVFARMGLALVNNLAAIDAVAQHQVERAAREWFAADHPTRGTRPRLA